MRQLTIILEMSVCLIILSCRKEGAKQELIEIDQPTFVSMDQAESEVLKLVSIVDGETKTGQSRRIVEKYSVGGPNAATTKSGEGENPLVYVFNFNDEKGFALASGDNRMPPVLCLTDEGNLTDTTSINEGALAMLSIIDTDYRMAVGLPITDNRGNTITAEQYTRPVNNLIDDEGGFGSGCNPSTYTTYTSWTSNSPIGTRLSTRWGQRTPFNYYCKTSTGKDAYVGCVAVAVGQVMAYWKKNILYNCHNYDWSKMQLIESYSTPTSFYYSEAWNLVQLLLSDIGRNENLDMDYGEVDNSDGSGAYCNYINRTFKHLGYSNGGNVQDYDISTLKNNIANGPVIGCGQSHQTVTTFLGINLWTTYSGGHEWVYDQYMTQDRYRQTFSRSTGKIISSVKETRTLVRCNWGWGGAWDGYYLSGQFDTNSGAVATKSVGNTSGKDNYYRYQLKIHTGIHP